MTISKGHNFINRTSLIFIGQLMTEFGGGGHQEPEVAGCQRAKPTRLLKRLSKPANTIELNA